MTSSCISRLLKISTVVALCFTAHSSFAELVTVDTKIIQLLPRDWGLHIRIEPAAVQSLQASGISCADNSVPVFELSKPNYKATSDALMLAYALRKKVKIYVENVAAQAPAGVVCLDGYAPKIYAVNVSDM